MKDKRDVFQHAIKDFGRKKERIGSDIESKREFEAGEVNYKDNGREYYD